MNDDVLIKVFLIHGVAHPWKLRKMARRAENIAWLEPLAAFLRETCQAEVHPFYWDGRLSKMNNVNTAQNCWDSMSECFDWPSADNDSIRRVVINKSGGASIVGRTLDLFGAALAEGSIDLEVRIASPIHGEQVTANIVRDRVLLLSRDDQLYKWLRRVGSLLPGWAEYEDPQQRIVWLSGLTHQEFNFETAVKFAQRTVSLFDLYAAAVRGDLSWISDTGSGEVQ